MASLLHLVKIWSSDAEGLSDSVTVIHQKFGKVINFNCDRSRFPGLQSPLAADLVSELVCSRILKVCADLGVRHQNNSLILEAAASAVFKCINTENHSGMFVYIKSDGTLTLVRAQRRLE